LFRSAESAFAALYAMDPGGNGTVTLPPGDLGTLESLCDYSYTISKYPEEGGGELKIPALNENAVQELSYGVGSDKTLHLSATPLTSNASPSLAIYLYSDDGKVTRKFYAFDNASKPENFEYKDPNNFTLDVPGNTAFIRLRPLNSGLAIIISDYPTTTGYKINSTGTAGIVNRKVEAYRFYSQLPAAFDEAVVMLGSE
ncbi:MAG: hypothetical protein QG570_268, partial [Patescibacteria group bacterium]|nr:hypothetical protein [Patescibacteria group bacterium]